MRILNVLQIDTVEQKIGLIWLNVKLYILKVSLYASTMKKVKTL